MSFLPRSKNLLIAGGSIGVMMIGAVVVNNATLAAQPDVPCKDGQVTIAVPKPNIGILDHAEAPTLATLYAQKWSSVSLDAIIAANPDLKLKATGTLPKSSSGKVCLTIPKAAATPAKKVQKTEPTTETADPAATPEVSAKGKA